MTPPFTLIVDTREPIRLAYKFSGFDVERAKLDTGDYSIKGLEHVVTVERKTKEDAWNCVAGSRKRFEQCLLRLAKLDRAAIVIECSLDEFAVPPSQIQRVTPATAVGSYISWACQYGLPVFWCGNKMNAERVTLRFLAAHFKHRSGLWTVK